MAAVAVRAPVCVSYEPRGAARTLFTCKALEVLLAGPAGTGKSRACLEKLHLCAAKYAGMRALVVRKTMVSLTATGLVTYKTHVLHPLDGVTFFGGSRDEPPAYRYPNGSRVLVGGLDDPQKIMSAEYDMVYVQEATELTENDWESLTTRLRNGVMPYQQLIADCNPGPPTHWLKRRADVGQTVLLESRHDDNPRLHDGHTWTAEGVRYRALLDGLSGARKARLRDGRWVSAEGVVYDTFDRAIHVVDRFDIPRAWRRIRAIDFGYTNPFSCSWYAIDPDGRMYLYRQLYMTGRLVSDHAREIRRLSEGEVIEATVADHDAEDRATLEAAGIVTQPAYKAISVGIEAVQKRLRVAGDGKPRLVLLRDSLVERDEQLAERSQPLCTEHEFDVYMWPKSQDGRALKEVPVDLYNHGLDELRYAVAYVDRLDAHAMPAPFFAGGGVSGGWNSTRGR